MSIRLVFLFANMLVFQANAITLNNGGYEDVYIVIQDSIEENLELLDRIQDIFTKASRLLFIATKQHVYFGKIKVVIPKSWSTQAFYKQLPALSSLETYINIDNEIIESPYVKSRNCGEEGLAMFLHPSFVLKTGKTNYGNHENAIVHEWGHLRWGLFDEYPTRMGRNVETFYQHAGKWKPVGCSHKIQGKIGRGSNCNTEHTNWCDTDNTGKKMQKTCYFCPFTDQDVKISLMAYQYIDKMTLFCDKDDETVPEDERHNSVAPTAQNEYCDHRSAWEVMREHSDFKGSEPLSETTTTPDFEFIQEKEIYRVFVLDVSGSMSANNKDGMLRQAAEYIIQEISAGSWLAIVTFSGNAEIGSNITQVNSQEDRNNLIASLPTYSGGSTCIGCGMDLAIKVLTDKVGSPTNGEIIIISDGQDNSGNIISSRSSAINASVLINTLAITQQADTLLSDIAMETGGKHYTYLESENISFAAVLREAVSDKGSVTSIASQSALLLSEKKSSNLVNTTFSIENGLGNSTSVTVLTTCHDIIYLELNGPENFKKSLTVNGTNATIKIDGIAKIGDYNIKITTSASGQSVEYLVTSSPTVKTNDVIRVVTRLSKYNIDISTGDLPIVYADVTKRNAPVINATVISIVGSNGGSCTLNLYDNGIEPDRLENDGTYSVYILPRCLAPGRVHIIVKVTGKGGEISLLYRNTGSATLNTEEEDIEEIIPDSFQRNVVTEELFISNYIYDESIDSIAPGRITDVEINNIETGTTQTGENRNFTLTWTATGDDKNQGQATLYEIRISSEISTLRDNFESADPLDMTNSTIYPQVVGTSEALKIVVNAEESYVETRFFALRAVDEVGNKGPVSNIVSIIVARGFRVYGEQGYAVNDTDDDIILDINRKSTSRSRDDPDIIPIVVGVVVGVLAFVAISTGLFIIKFKNFTKENTAVKDSNTMTEVEAYHPKQLECINEPASTTVTINDDRYHWLK